VKWLKQPRVFVYYAEDSGCTSPTFKYSPTTGKPCGITTTNVVKCPAGDLFSSVTGQRCTLWQDDSSDSILLNRELKIGSRGDDVIKLQQLLKELGILLGKIDGSYGPITAKAVREYQQYNSLITTGQVDPETREQINIRPIPPTCVSEEVNGVTKYVCPPKDSVPPTYSSVTISGVSGPQSLDVGQTGTWVVKAYDKNGGNLSYSVVWGDEERMTGTGSNSGVPASAETQQTATFTHSYSRVGIYKPIFFVTNDNDNINGTAQTSLSVNVGNNVRSSITVLSPNGGETWAKGTTQTIKWEDNSSVLCSVGACAQAGQIYDIVLRSTCFSDVCEKVSVIIAKGVSTPYNWTIPNCKEGSECSSNFSIPIGSYTIQVCQTGTTICDSSDSYFKIVASDTTTNSSPIINGLPAIPVGINVGQSVSFSWHATDADNDNLSWSVDWGNEGSVATCQINPPKGTGQNWNYTASHTWTSPGTYTVRATASDCRGGSNGHTSYVTVGGSAQY